MGSFTEKDVTELKTLSNCPEAVKRVLTATLLLIGYSEQEAKQWEKALASMKAGTKDSLKARCDGLVVDQVPLEVAVKAKEHLGDVTLDRVLKASKAAGAICRWTLTVVEQVLQKGNQQ